MEDEGDVILLPAFLFGVAYVPAGFALGRLEALGVAEDVAVFPGGREHFREVALGLSTVAMKHEHQGAVGAQAVGHEEVVFALTARVRKSVFLLRPCHEGQDSE